MRLGSRLRSLGVAAILAFTLLIATRQLGCSGMYSAHPAYRAQVNAVLSGELALSHQPEGLSHDLAWVDGSVQQVWGLGVAMWQAPFEAGARAIGADPFPDRVAMGLWLALVLFVVIRAFRPRDGEAWWIGAGCVVLAAFLPAFVTMVRGRLGVYEEAATYAYGAGLLLLGGVVLFARSPTRLRLLVLLFAAGLTGFIRPTVWFYGLGTAIVASTIYLRAHGRRGLLPVAGAIALFLAGGLALYATNAARFGSGTEFGHRLNLHSLPGNIVATRFSYPFERAGVIEASVELAGALFDRPERKAGRGYYRDDLHVGQSDLPRWREYYFTTYSWPYLPALLGGVAVGALAFRRRKTESSDPRLRAREHDDDTLARRLLAWAVLGGLPLVVFYLFSPSLTSRYQLDLGPAIVAVLVIGWRALAIRATATGKGLVAFGVLLALWIAAIATSSARHRVPADLLGKERAALTTRMVVEPPSFARTFPAAYDRSDPELVSWIATDQHARPRGLYLNGIGWDLASGTVPPAIHLFLNDPTRLEVDVDGQVDEHAVRAVIGLETLRLVSRAPAATGTRFVFALARPLVGLHVVFIAFGPDTELDKARTSYALRAVRWR